ncbi:MAG TPA: hypothetical protein VHE99_12885 [Gammaproteobacteria bacterium]|nr:hypothetical protein [Gammaproteobacteria bacterium]
MSDYEQKEKTNFLPLDKAAAMAIARIEKIIQEVSWGETLKEATHDVISQSFYIAVRDANQDSIQELTRLVQLYATQGYLPGANQYLSSNNLIATVLETQSNELVDNGFLLRAAFMAIKKLTTDSEWINDLLKNPEKLDNFILLLQEMHMSLSTVKKINPKDTPWIIQCQQDMNHYYANYILKRPLKEPDENKYATSSSSSSSSSYSSTSASSSYSLSRSRAYSAPETSFWRQKDDDDGINPSAYDTHTVMMSDGEKDDPKSRASPT